MPKTELTEADAMRLVESFIDEFHQMLFWYLRKNCHAPKEMAEDALQLLWLDIFQRLTREVNRPKVMYKTYFFNKAKWIHLDIQRRVSQEDPMGITAFDLAGEDEHREQEEEAAKEMLKQRYEETQSPSNYSGSFRAEPSNQKEEDALFKSFWANYPEIELTEEQKLVAFDLFRFGFTLKEVSNKYGIPISTVSDWKRKIQHRVEKAHFKEEDDAQDEEQEEEQQ